MKQTAITPLKENRLHGTADFPCACYHADSALFPADKPFLVKHHWHEELEIIYFQRGNFHLEINMEKYEITEECFCLVGSGDLHYICSEDHFRETAFVFSLSMLCASPADPVQIRLVQPLTEGTLALPRLIFRENPCFAVLKQEFFQINAAADLFAEDLPHRGQYRIGSLPQYMRAKAALFHIFAVLSEQDLLTASETGVNRQIDTVKKSLSYMQEHLTEKIGMPELAAQANMNEQYFCRFFKKAIGKPPIAYLNEMRIKYACSLLKDTDHSVTEICLESGFNNLGNFMRTFKIVCGCTPLQYRKGLQKECVRQPDFQRSIKKSKFRNF